MIENGFIKLYRSLVSWEWYSDIITSRVFIHLLLTVNFEDIQWQGITIKRGERVYSFASLSDEIGITVQQLRSALKRLTITNEITSRSTTKYSVVTVKNYDRYQGATHQSTNEQHSNQQAINTQPNKQTTRRPTSKSTNKFNTVSADITEENDFDSESATSDSTNDFCENQHTVGDEINTPINNNIRSIKNKEVKNNKNGILPPTSPAIPDVDLFSEFWKAYPKKTAKLKAQQAFNKFSVTQDMLNQMLSALEVQRKSDEWSKEGGKYIPYPATWLNGRRWEDEIYTPLTTDTERYHYFEEIFEDD